jgi:glycosyltransferase involved in cell wall biosynthesis
MKIMKEKTKVLFFANIPVENEDRSIGGATVLAEKIKNHLSTDERINLSHVQIRSFWRNKLQLIDYFIWAFTFPFHLRNIDVVSFHGTKDFHFTIAPMLWIWAKLFNKKVCYHFFGGNFHEQYEAFPSFIKYLLKKTILNSDTVFFETLEMLKYFEKQHIKNSVWLPNSREAVITTVARKEFRKKFVFISRVIPQKGIVEIIEAANELPQDYTIDVYGPIDDRHYTEKLFKNSKATYKGLLDPKDVITKLLEYDVLLLPSYFSGEGYPGIIIEALSLAMPVIATKWKALPEIITNEHNGSLIDIKNANQLKNAILNFNKENYPSYSNNALDSFRNFDSAVVFNKIIERYLL